MSDPQDNESKLALVKQALIEKRVDDARGLLVEMLKADPGNAEAWFISSLVVPGEPAQIEMLERALALRPEYPAARARLDKLRSILSGVEGLPQVAEPLSASAPPTPRTAPRKTAPLEDPFLPPSKPAQPSSSRLSQVSRATPAQTNPDPLPPIDSLAPLPFAEPRPTTARRTQQVSKARTTSTVKRKKSRTPLAVIAAVIVLIVLIAGGALLAVTNWPRESASETVVPSSLPPASVAPEATSVTQTVQVAVQPSMTPTSGPIFQTTEDVQFDTQPTADVATATPEAPVAGTPDTVATGAPVTVTSPAPVAGTPGTVATGAPSKPTIDAFAAQIIQARATINDAINPVLTAFNVGKLAPIAQVSMPAFFVVYFHDDRPTLMFQTGAVDGGYIVGDLLDSQPLMRLSAQYPADDAFVISRDQAVVLSASGTRVALVDPATRRIVATMQETGAIFALSPDGTLLAAASETVPSVRLWNLHTQVLQATIDLADVAQDRGPHSLLFSDDGRSLAVGACDGSLRVVDVAAGTQTRLRESSGGVDCVDVIGFARDGRSVVALDNNRIRRIPTNGAGTGILTFQGMPTDTRPKLALSPDGSLLAALNEQTLVVWDFDTARSLVVQSVPAGVTEVSGMTFTANGRFIVTAVKGGVNGLTWWGVPRGTAATEAADVTATP